MPDRFANEEEARPRFGFNGMEREDEIAGLGNSYTAMFWQYDSRTGRRWNQDPVDMYSLSRYATFANNPIAFTDPLGAIIEGDDTSMEGYQAFKNFISNRIEEFEENEDTETETFVAFNETLDELDVLEKSPTLYKLQYRYIPSNDKISVDADMGYKYYSEQKKWIQTITVNVKGIDRENVRWGVLAHELKHAYQKENFQEYYFDYNSQPNYGLEIEAYQRQFYFMPMANGRGGTISDVNDIDKEFVDSKGEAYLRLKGTSDITPVPQISLKSRVFMALHNLNQINDYKEIYGEEPNPEEMSDLYQYNNWLEDLKAENFFWLNILFMESEKK